MDDSTKQLARTQCAKRFLARDEPRLSFSPIDLSHPRYIEGYIPEVLSAGDLRSVSAFRRVGDRSLGSCQLPSREVSRVSRLLDDDARPCT